MHRRNISFHKHLIFQVSLFISIVSIVTITFLSSYLSHKQTEAISLQLRNEAIIVADNLAAASSPYVITRNYTSIEEILIRAAQFENINSMQIIDINGNTLSNVGKNKNNEVNPQFDILFFKPPSNQKLTINQSDESIEVFNPIILGDVVGWVRIVYSLNRIKHVKNKIWANNLTNGFVITVITIGILIFFLRRPVTTLKKYTDFADKLNRYNGDVIQVDKRATELRRLGTALNSASVNLFENHEQLQETLSDMERVASIVEYSPDIIMSIGINNSIKYLNAAAKNTIYKLLPSDDDTQIIKLLPNNISKIFQRCMSENIPFENIESQINDHIFLWKFTPFCSQQVLHCHATDITDKKLAEEKLAHQENYDLLTNLPNRVLALDRLKQSIKRSKRLNNHVGILFLGVDRFKTVNDTLGHGSGDKIIKAISERLSSCLREGDTLARFAGDIFLIILNDLRQTLDSKIVAEKAIDIIAEVFELDNHKFHLGLSIGITSYPDDNIDAGTLVRNADIAMHKAKESGGNMYQFYASEFNEQALIRVEMESELRRALDNNELFLTFQPQIDITSNKIIGAEALIRWVNDKLGFVGPDQFIPMAEDTGLIIPIGEWVLKTACIEAKKWQDTFGFSLRVAVNVSARQFAGQNFPAIVDKVLNETGLSAHSLELEITESLLVDDAPGILSAITDLKEMGITLALDDFGTGYSSLSYLKRFPFDILKIDRAFIQDVMENPEDASLCKAIVAIATSLKLNVIGEGVETKEQLDFLNAIGTDIAQGYYYSKPLKALDFVEYVDKF